jgi:alpha-tubulin suppressor-like RCC1 family protein
VKAGEVWCWGLNDFGQLGDGTKIDHAAPARVTGLSNVVSVSASSEHTCALEADKSVWCWGLNHFGELGDGTTTDSLVPVRAHL